MPGTVYNRAYTCITYICVSCINTHSVGECQLSDRAMCGIYISMQ